MHSMDNYYVSKLLPLMRESGVAAIANPLINITLQGRQRYVSQAPRHDARAGDDGAGYPRRRSATTA